MDQSQVWNQIAKSWDNFRHKPLEELKSLNWKKGKILDIGCGNCRNLLPFKNFGCYGIDFSEEMLKQAKNFTKKNNFKVNLKLASAEKISYKDNLFDYVLAIAILHHLKNPEIGIKEIHRVLKNNGEAYITIWNKLQLKLLFKRKETYVPWKQKSQTLMRYYHFIGYFELRSLLKKNNFIIIKSKLFGKNIEFRVKKLIS
ncbi:class I SAM-dependent methyltransferase [Candidatus Woesearchaeota archaeon]|nr:class I SAM-dependent methyltransferase [Candidatus Woesearchaeota archaeon]